MCFDGVEEVGPLITRAFGPDRDGDWRLVPTREPHASGRELPAPPGDTVFRAFKLDVLRVDGAKIAEITTFDSTLFPEFGLPATL